MSSNNDYIPPKVWKWEKPRAGEEWRYSGINRPIAGPTHEAELPVGKHPLQLYSRGTPNGVKVRRLLEHSLAIDPNYARASAWVEPLDADYLKPATLDRAHQLARRAFQLDPNLPEAHARLGMVLIRRRDCSAGIAAFERALALNPDITDFSIAHSLVLAGEPARAVEAANRQKRLDPFHAPLVPAALGMAHYMLRQHSEALPPLRECAARRSCHSSCQNPTHALQPKAAAGCESSVRSDVSHETIVCPGRFWPTAT